MILKPKYLHRPIGSIRALALKLGESESSLRTIAQNADRFYIQNPPEVKPDGRLRIHYTVKSKLKVIQERIKSNIFYAVYFPEYLQGSIKSSERIKRGYDNDASLHIGARLVISEDVSDFFPSITSEIIYMIWKDFFRFPSEVSEILTMLTTYEGALVQGSSTSSYLANLLFWDVEHRLVEELSKNGFTYTRYVDDLTISTKSSNTTNLQKSEILSKVIRMLKSKGVNINRKKHLIAHANKRMTVHNLTINSNHPSVGKKKKKQIRLEVYNLNKLAQVTKRRTTSYRHQFQSVSGKVENLRKFHPALADKLATQLNELRPIKD